MFTAAVLGKFDMIEVEGLRDSDDWIRIAAAKGLASKRGRDSVGILIHKASQEVLRALSCKPKCIRVHLRDRVNQINRHAFIQRAGVEGING